MYFITIESQSVSQMYFNTFPCLNILAIDLKFYDDCAEHFACSLLIIEFFRSQLRRTVTQSLAVHKVRLPRVSLKDVWHFYTLHFKWIFLQILFALQKGILCFIIQANARILPPAPPVVDPLREHIANIKEQARVLKKVDVRTENGVIIIN